MTPAMCQVILSVHAEANGGPKAAPVGRPSASTYSDGADLFALAAMPTH